MIFGIHIQEGHSEGIMAQISVVLVVFKISKIKLKKKPNITHFFYIK